MRERQRVQSASHLFDLLPVFGGAACGVDADALLEHGHAGLRLAALDLRQPALLLLVPRPQVLDHSLVVALHVFQLLRRQKNALRNGCLCTFKAQRREIYLLVFLHKLVPLEEELVFQLLLQQLVSLVKILLLQVPNRGFAL